MPWLPTCKAWDGRAAAGDCNMPDMDINYLRGAALLLLIIAFLAMWKWAWSDKRKPDFKKMSELPLEEDRNGKIPHGSTAKAEKSEAKE